MYQQSFKQFLDLLEPFNTQVSKQLSANISLIEELVCAQTRFISQAITEQSEIPEALNAAQGLPNLIETHKKHSSLATQRTQQYWANAFKIMQVCLQAGTNDTVVPKSSNASESKAVKTKLELGMKQPPADRKPAMQVKKAAKRARVKPAVNKNAVVASNAQISEKTNKSDVGGKAKSSPRALLKTPVKAPTKLPVKPSVQENKAAIKEVAKIADKIAVKSVKKAASSLVLKPASHKKPVALDSKNTASASTVQPISNKVEVVDKAVLEDSK